MYTRASHYEHMCAEVLYNILETTLQANITQYTFEINTQRAVLI